MKKMIFSLLTVFGTLTAGYTAQFSAPNADFVFIRGGTFTMGSPASEDWRGADEAQHRVTVSTFYMSKYEVTQKQFREVTGSSPSHFSGDALPVENVTWLEAVEFCNVLSKREGRTPAYTVSADTQTGFDMVELEPVKPYSSNYNTCLNEAQRDQHNQERPALKTKIAGFDRYDTVILGYPNWWASIPMRQFTAQRCCGMA